MAKRSIVLLLALLAVLPLLARSKSRHLKLKELTLAGPAATSECPTDRSLIFLNLPLDSVDVDGNAVAGPLVRVTGGYQFLVVAGMPNAITIYHDRYEPLEIELHTSEGDKLMGSKAYNITIVVPEETPSPLRALVPGMVQLQKGYTARGVAFMAAEAAAIGGIVAFEGLRSSYQSKIGTTHHVKDRQNYIDKANNMQNLRNVCIAGAAAVYVWNVVDALTLRKKRRRAGGLSAMSLTPYAAPDQAGMAFAMNF